MVLSSPSSWKSKYNTKYLKTRKKPKWPSLPLITLEDLGYPD